jgi:hypothetical protein
VARRAPDQSVAALALEAVADPPRGVQVLDRVAEETDDGLSGKEGSYLICSFWLISALAITGETHRARQLMELVKAASPLGLYAEEFDAETIVQRPGRNVCFGGARKGGAVMRRVECLVVRLDRGSSKLPGRISLVRR